MDFFFSSRTSKALFDCSAPDNTSSRTVHGHTKTIGMSITYTYRLLGNARPWISFSSRLEGRRCFPQTRFQLPAPGRCLRGHNGNGIAYGRTFLVTVNRLSDPLRCCMMRLAVAVLVFKKAAIFIQLSLYTLLRYRVPWVRQQHHRLDRFLEVFRRIRGHRARQTRCSSPQTTFSERRLAMITCLCR